MRMDSAAEIAAAHKMRAALMLPGGQMIANPIPLAAEIPAPELAPIIAQALAEAKKGAITAKAVTPFLLQRIFELTDGRSLQANITLMRNNALLASAIATE